MNLNEVKYITIHCSASRPNQSHGVDEINAMHIARGWNGIGYHFVIRRDGSVERGRSIYKTGAGVFGFNRNNIHICYEGGLDDNGKPADTRTPEQIHAMDDLVADCLKKCPLAVVMGHRDFSPDVDGDGIIEPWEFIKACPCFDAKTEYADLRSQLARF